jgi:hypothetical protein
MEFELPDRTKFQAPDDWWASARMSNFIKGSNYYQTYNDPDLLIVPLSAVEPPRRRGGYEFEFGGFYRDSFVSILHAFLQEDPIPPIVVSEVLRDEFQYRVREGYHRFYVSAAAGFEYLPVLLAPRSVHTFDLRRDAGVIAAFTFTRHDSAPHAIYDQPRDAISDAPARSESSLWSKSKPLLEFLFGKRESRARDEPPNVFRIGHDQFTPTTAANLSVLWPTLLGPRTPEILGKSSSTNLASRPIQSD